MIGIVETVVGIFVGVSGLWWNYRSRIDAQFDRTRALLAEAHSGALATARHSLGCLIEGRTDDELENFLLDEQCTQRLFDMLWFFQRTWAVYRSFNRPIRWTSRPTRTQRYLIDSLCPEICTWERYRSALDRRATGSNGDLLELSPSSNGLANLHPLAEATLNSTAR